MVKINSFLATPEVGVKTESNRNMQGMPSKAGSPVSVATMKQEGLLNLLFALQCLDLGAGARYTMQIAAAGSCGQGLNIHFMSLKSTIALLNHGSGPANLIYCRVKSSIYFKICLFPSFYLRLTPECSPGIVMTVSVCYLLHNYHLAT